MWTCFRCTLGVIAAIYVGLAVSTAVFVGGAYHLLKLDKPSRVLDLGRR